jgi:hypothetical protein
MPQAMGIGSFGEEPSDQPIDLLHTAFLPTVIGGTKNDSVPKALFIPSCHVFSLLVS